MVLARAITLAHLSGLDSGETLVRNHGGCRDSRFSYLKLLQVGRSQERRIYAGVPRTWSGAITLGRSRLPRVIPRFQ
jgi:hypothetical protein